MHDATESVSESESESDLEHEREASEASASACVSDDESGAERVPVSASDEPERLSDGDDDNDENKSDEPERVSDGDDDDDENKHENKCDEMPSLSPTRSKPSGALGGMDEWGYGDEIVDESDGARSVELPGPLPEDEEATPGNDSAEVKSSSDADDDEYEVVLDSILT